MDGPSNAVPPSAPAENKHAIDSAVQYRAAARLRFWAWAAGLLLLFLLTMFALLFLVQSRQLTQLRRELEALKSESVRFGQGVEIYNPAWGTVIDGVDPQRFPSRDARDPRYGAGVQQYMPRGNVAQIWQLRAPSPPTEQDPPLPEQAYIRHARSFISARDFIRAVQAFEFCLRLYPESAQAHGGLGVAWRDRGDFVRALTSHDRAVELEPARPGLRWERSVTRMRAGDAGGAIRDCQSVVGQNPEFADAHNTMAMAYRTRRNYTEALKHHDRAIELNPDREDFWRERSVTHQANGDQQKSAEDAARAREVREARR
jgi:tetratricopeptide (TPR) repeat protein